MPHRTVRLCAALPYALDDNGSPVVMLVRRPGGRWELPMARALADEPPHVAAARAAYAAAGVVGCVVEEPLGAHSRDERGTDGAPVRCIIDVYPLIVEAIADEGPGAAGPALAWLAPEGALALVDDPGLIEVIGCCARWLAADRDRSAEADLTIDMAPSFSRPEHVVSRRSRRASNSSEKA